MQYSTVGKNAIPRFNNPIRGIEVYPAMHAPQLVARHIHRMAKYQNPNRKSPFNLRQEKIFKNALLPQMSMYNRTGGLFGLQRQILRGNNNLAKSSTPPNLKNLNMRNYVSDLRSNLSQNHHNVETTMTILSDRVIVDMTEESDKEIESTAEEASKLTNSLHRMINPFNEQEELPIDGNTPPLDFYFQENSRIWDDKSSIPEFPYWDNKLASRSEEIVKADQAPDKPFHLIMQESVAYFQNKYNPRIQNQKDDYNSNFEE